MTSRIVVGTDGSEHARHALRWALLEARLRAARLTVVHAWSPPLPMSSFGPMLTPIDLSEFEQVAKGVLEADIADALETTGVPESTIDPLLVRGYAPTALLQQATDADLLVVGSRGRGGFRGLLTGSVSHHCANHAPGPVAVVRFEAPLPDDGDVIVGVDGSRGSMAALRFGLQEAAVRHARLVVAHAWWVEHPGSADSTLPFFTVDRSEYRARSLELMREMVEEASAESKDQPLDVELLPLEDAAANALIALTVKAGLLVVGSRGHGGFAGLLVGSVSHQCVQHAHTAVVVVPDADGRG